MPDKPQQPASWYAASAHAAAAHPRLQGALQADVCVLGAGLTGLNSALELAEAGYKVIVLESESVGWGASGRNGGQVIFGFGCGEGKLQSLVGKADARRLFDWSLEGVRMIRERIVKHDIACDWRAGHAHVAIRPRQVSELKHWQHELGEHYGYPLQWWDREQLQATLPSERYLGALYDANSGHLHPLNYTLGLARAAGAAGVRIFEGSKVLRMEHGARPVLHTQHGSVQCDFVVLAGNALVKGIAPELDRKIMPVGTYIGATPALGADRARALITNDMAVADMNWALDYFRLSADHRLLFGGRASYSNLPPPNLRGVMRARMHTVFPQLKGVDFEYLWGGVIDISRNRAPHWGRLHDNVYFAQGFSGHGVAATGLAGRVIGEAIRGQAERLDVFARIHHRDFPGGRALRTPLLVAAMAWFKLRDALW
ncbi:MAG: FAD-binding oxidoreductase [Xanthomonadaceae bacterium]|nr:FAD-binding oxidoreductase [Xanthomonadaceae bacterium]MDZ4379037.1 FAD-binding oxidoreductase [Xanthomonadaceae bacterium]